MYKFALQMWQQRRIDEAYLMYQVEMRRLSQAEVDAILAPPQNPIVE